jgi:hypothetical protein
MEEVGFLILIEFGHCFNFSQELEHFSRAWTLLILKDLLPL